MIENKIVLEMLFIILGSALIFESIEVKQRPKIVALIGMVFIIFGVQI